jgi:D-alanine-D-alanine ligase
MTAKRFRKVVVLMGGPSSEREVSLKSGAAVARGLREAGYEVTELDIAGPEFDVPAGTEAAFIALHGEFGEDGRLQAILDRRGLPYTGSGAAASQVAFDKVRSKAVFVQAGIPTPRYAVVRERGAALPLPPPVVVKPACQGSTIGINRVLASGEWPAARDDAFRFGPELVVEAYIEGRELTVGIVDQEALPAIEIVAPGGWYDYRAKYTKGQTQYLVPAPLDAAVAAACRAIALRTFEALDCRAMGRVDFRLSPAGELTVLELNSIPGFTETSLLPKAAAAAGIGFAALCDRIMRLARAG